MVPLLLLLHLLCGGSLQEQQRYELRVQGSVMVQKGLCVHVPCSFYPWSPWSSSGKLYIYVYQKGYHQHKVELVATNVPTLQVKTETLGRFFLTNPRTNNCSLSIRDARKRDAGIYFFRVERRSTTQHTYQDEEMTLLVTAPGPRHLPLSSSDLTQKPDIRILGTLESGHPAWLECTLLWSCEGRRRLSFSWVGDALDSLSPKTLRSSKLTFTPKPGDHGTKITCLVTLEGPQVTTQNTIRLNVSYAPRNLTVVGSYRNVTALNILQTTSLLILEDEAPRLLCVADSNPPAQLSWFRGSPSLNSGPISSTRVLELPRMGTGGEGQFTCRAQNRLGSRTLRLRLFVVYPPRLLGPFCSWEDQGLRCSCSSRGQPAPSLRWRLGEGLLAGNHSNASHAVTSRSAGPWVNGSLSLRAGLGAGLRLSCEAENVHGAQSGGALLLPERPVCVSRVVPAALGGAGAMALLSLGLCLISFCIVKTRRQQTGRRRRNTNDEDPVMGAVTWGSQRNPKRDRPPDQVLPTRDASPSREEEDAQYANLRFHRGNPWEPPDEKATSTCEYSLAISLPDTGTWTRSALSGAGMVPLLLLPLLWGGSLQEQRGYELRVQESVRVLEGLTVHVPCSFSYPWNSWPAFTLYTYWYRNGHDRPYKEPVATNSYKQVRKETQNRFVLTDPKSNDNCSLRIRDARKSDTGIYVFRVERGADVKYTYQDKKLNLRVTGPKPLPASYSALTDKPDILVPEPLESGRPARLSCSVPGACEGGTPLSFSWAGAAVDSLDPQSLRSSVLTFTPSPRDHGANLTCQVQCQGFSVTKERTIRLNVSYAPQLTISLSQGNSTVLKTLSNLTSLPVLEGESLRLVCVADSNPPATLHWSLDGKALTTTQLSAPGVLELPPVGAGDGGEFSCRARHPLGSQHVSFSLSVQRRPPSCRCVTGEQQGSWPLVLTLIRGALMGTGFLLTYGLTRLYYTRCGGPERTEPSPD
ncbi:LOW QUALITY PROTEIN: sialic acid-binding Ig-like lectin 5 [Pteronotus mesoamericanus]|uniref:LOW QUALITY PROTEIN: sialic acid-binding Ig-like lectin 5 n=1 Tax=Pteronotus mesoamericanus TaxID=1884717 RepID=UPI0023EDD3FB|nr:LOW QUALITY PROTEIN: sialic acid-binding Ig-like lectin 5 [Pteronotus parnellii mesoamericanus]